MNRLSFFKTLAMGLSGAAFAPNLLLPKSPDAYRWKRGDWLYTTDDFTFNERDYMGTWKFVSWEGPIVSSGGYVEICGQFSDMEPLLQ